MTNDLTTLSGALLEMKDQLIYELGQKGVTASYDSTTGLLGLIGKIGDIQTGSSCYHIEFSEASYTAVGGSATLELTLQQNYAPVSGATVSVAGSDSSLYSGLTNSSGIATITVSGITSNTTFTASYGNVSDTCTVTVSNVIFSDDCTTDKTSTTWGSSISLRNSGTASVTYTTGSPNYYLIANTRNSSEAFVPYAELEGITDSFKLTIKAKTETTSNPCLTGLYYYIDSNNWGGVKGMISEQWISSKTNGTFNETQYTTGQSNTTNYYTNEITFNSVANTLTVNTYDSNDSLIQSKTMNIPITLTSSVKWGTSTTWSNTAKTRVSNVKAEYI